MMVSISFYLFRKCFIGYKYFFVGNGFYKLYNKCYEPYCFGNISLNSGVIDCIDGLNGIDWVKGINGINGIDGIDKGFFSGIVWDDVCFNINDFLLFFVFDIEHNDYCCTLSIEHYMTEPMLYPIYYHFSIVKLTF